MLQPLTFKINEPVCETALPVLYQGGFVHAHNANHTHITCPLGTAVHAAILKKLVHLDLEKT